MGFGLADAPLARLLLLEGSLLLSGREWLVQLPIDEEIAEDAARAPGDAISPSLNARSMLFVDEDVSTSNEILAFAIMRASGYVIETAM